jgi:hypothetical protein
MVGKLNPIDGRFGHPRVAGRSFMQKAKISEHAFDPGSGYRLQFDRTAARYNKFFRNLPKCRPLRVLHIFDADIIDRRQQPRPF